VKSSLSLQQTKLLFQSVVVVGGGVGEFEENLKSVEFLSEGELQWTLGQDLPTPIRDSTMVTDQVKDRRCKWPPSFMVHPQSLS
jgi:hypothetical protein